MLEVRFEKKEIEIRPIDAAKEKGWDIFLNEDPQYDIELKKDGTLLELTFMAKSIQNAEMLKYVQKQLNVLKKRLEEKEQVNKMQQHKIEAMEQTKTWKMREIIRKIKR